MFFYDFIVFLLNLYIFIFLYAQVLYILTVCYTLKILKQDRVFPLLLETDLQNAKNGAVTARRCPVK